MDASLDPGSLPPLAPSWFEQEPEGLRVTVHRPSLPMPVYHADGSRTLDLGYDMVTGRAPAERLKTPEEQFREREGR